MSAAEVTAAYFKAVGDGDRAALTAVLHPQVVYRFPGRNPFSKVYRSRDEVLDYIDGLRTVTGGTMQVTVQDVLVGERRCAGWVRAEARRGDRAFGWNLVAVIDTDGTAITEIALYYDDQYGVDAFLAEEEP